MRRAVWVLVFSMFYKITWIQPTKKLIFNLIKLALIYIKPYHKLLVCFRTIVVSENKPGTFAIHTQSGT